MLTIESVRLMDNEYLTLKTDGLYLVQVPLDIARHMREAWLMQQGVAE